MPSIDGPSVFLRMVSETQQSTIKGNSSVTLDTSNPLRQLDTVKGYYIRIAPNKGTVTIDSNTGNWVYQPSVGYTGNDFFVVGIDVTSLSPPNNENGNEVLDSNENPPPRETITEQLHTRVDLEIEQDPLAASTAGDPYVWPIKSNVPVKLPDACAVYRMFEQGNTYINAFVDCATAEHKQRMMQFFNNVASGLPIKPIIDGFFYQHLFIHSDGHEMMIDLAKKKDSYSNVEAKEYFKSEIETDIFKTTNCYKACNKFTIRWTTSEGIRQSASVLFFANPHIENGITMRTSSLENATGMMIDNYKPKFMKIPSITTTKYDKLWRRLNRTKKQHHFMDIKPKTEKGVDGNSNGKLLVK